MIKDRKPRTSDKLGTTTLNAAGQLQRSEEDVASAEAQIVEHAKKIEFYITEYTVELLAQKMQNGDFEVPSYQREFTWEPERKSRFIESLLMGLPIPFLYFWEVTETGKLEIVDGSQRLRTIEEFVLGDFALGELEELSLLLGFTFKDLPESRQRKFKNRSIRGIVLNKNADEQSRFDLFDRINTGSKVANKAEVRRGVLGGQFLSLVIDLSTTSVFNKLAPVTYKQDKEREKEELITRFFAYTDGLDDYKDRVSAFLFNYTKKMNKHLLNNPSELDVYKDKFIKTMTFVEKTFPWGFRKTATAKVTPRARFEAIAIGSYLALEEQSDLINKKVSVEDWLEGDEFKSITGADGANGINRLKGRIYFVRDRLLGK